MEIRIVTKTQPFFLCPRFFLSHRLLSRPLICTILNAWESSKQPFELGENLNSETETMEHHDETGCRALEGPTLCINNCGFFGSAATMNMCSKCHKDLVLKQEQAQLAACSIGNIVNGGGSTSRGKDPVVASNADIIVAPVDPKVISEQLSVPDAVSSESTEPKGKVGPTRCTMCKKRVGLTGFNCRCGNVFCSTHRYSDSHLCPFDYRTAARDAIAKANPVVKAEKLDKI